MNSASIIEHLPESLTSPDFLCEHRFLGDDEEMADLDAAIIDALEVSGSELLDLDDLIPVVRRALYLHKLEVCDRGATILESTQEMIRQASGFDQAGNPVSIKPDQLKAHTCTWNGEQITYITVEHTVGECTESIPVYFLSGYCFHPDNRPTPKRTNRVPALAPPRRDRVWIVDTGDTSKPPGSLFGLDDDPIFGDVARGHGPAIQGLVERLGGSSLTVELHQVRYFSGAVVDTSGAPCALVMPTAFGGGDVIRAFDEQALMKTLHDLTPRLEPTDIVNMSFGVVMCPEVAMSSPVAAWMRQQQGVRFVVAAGNHGTSAPSWPAAFASDLGGAPPIPGVHSVGSGKVVVRPNATPTEEPDSFSGRNPTQDALRWVTDWEDGSEVQVDMPPNTNPLFVHSASQANAVWTGTSFAAPRVAAHIARHVTTFPGDEVDSGGSVIGRPDLALKPKPATTPREVVIDARQRLGRTWSELRRLVRGSR